MNKLRNIVKVSIVITNCLLAIMLILGYAQITTLTIAGILFQLAAIFIDW